MHQHFYFNFNTRPFLLSESFTVFHFFFQPTYPDVPPPMLEYSSAQYPNDITVVTGYFNLGTFQKGPLSYLKFSVDTYKNWMNAYSKLNKKLQAQT